MDFKVATLIALMIASVVSLPHQQPGEIAGDQEAPKCPCGKIYFPLCGSDGNSYSNMCEFNCQARHVWKHFGTQLFVVADSRCEEI